MNDLDPVSRLINDQLPPARRRKFAADERLADIGLHILLINEVVDDIEIEFGIGPPPAVNQVVAERQAKGVALPVLFDTTGLTVGDLREAAGSGHWPERLYETGQAPSA
ncbi:hypothetical protein [Caulobacter sp. NIBR1757]|uniref:hypothetical protein n=1 Tax=Caulobacter sp. NIBR1757 TaxID=3016000 RepID=UPI0022F1330C|nr:hypothetical protein [Caulobacter sp. NIBR1757]WGM37978.1 hypothetical protein AMEJIAPC_00879 [Caulobacter sp. NIBR1757]